MNPCHRFMLIVLFALALVTVPVAAQTDAVSTDSLAAAFEAYDCTFIPETNSVQISTSLTGANGLPIPTTDFTLSIVPVGQATPLIPDDVVVASISQRPPLQMIIVLDTTETVPVEEIVGKMVQDLFPRLLVEDEVALITFSQEIQPRTAFYTDKNRLVNEHVLDLQTLEGDNRLYAAMLEATTSFQLYSDARRVVLVLSDSGRRGSDTTTVEQIVTRAQLNDVQVFPIGFYTRDFPRPSREDFFAIASGTGGYAWFYDQPYIDRFNVADAIGGFLNEFVDTLNSEILVTINMQSIDTGASNFIDFTLIANTTNDAIIETTVNCPIERLDHSIAFADDLNDLIVRGSVDLGVVATSDFDTADTVIIFRVNDEIVQDTGESIFTFNSADYEIGYYTVTAELRDRRGNVLATTPTAIRLFNQKTLGLSLSGAQADAVSGGLTLSATAPASDSDFTEVEFTVAPVTNPEDAQILGRAPFDINGVATLELANVNTAIEGLFGSVNPGTQFVFGARVLGITTTDPLFAVADSVTVRLAAAPLQPTPVPDVPQPEAAPEPQPLDERLIWLAIGIAALIVNILLFNAVRRARIRKLINHPDDYELSPRLMTITVYSGGVSQSHTLTKRTVFVGRGSSNDINLGSDSNISRNHGVIMWRDGYWYYTNRKSRLTCRINDRLKRGLIYQRLKPFTEIMIGNALMVFHENSQQDVADFVKTNI